MNMNDVNEIFKVILFVVLAVLMVIYVIYAIIRGILALITLYKINKNNCKMTISELGGYVWDDKAKQRGEEKPVKLNDHAMDAMRYFINTIMSKK